jgi:hypothetical protein
MPSKMDPTFVDTHQRYMWYRQTEPRWPHHGQDRRRLRGYVNQGLGSQHSEGGSKPCPIKKVVSAELAKAETASESTASVILKLWFVCSSMMMRSFTLKLDGRMKDNVPFSPESFL